MAHEVEKMAYAGDVPWHGLGTKVPHDISVDDMLVRSGLDWTVSKEPIFRQEILGLGEYAQTQNFVIEDKVALMRDSDNTVLDIVGTKWNPVQNHEAFDFFNQYIEEGNMELHSC